MPDRGAIRGNRSSRRRAGAVFAGFRIERELGRGGMGTVYLARELALDRQVALKVIREELADDERFRRRFRSESRTAASIDHPRVVTVFAAGERNGLLYVAMRYVPGLDLQRLITTRGPLKPEPAAALIAEVGEGLDAVHAAGLVHRDVKPANVIVSDRLSGNRAAHAFLTDFGLARAIASQRGITATGELIGSVDYMSPEQIKGGRVDARTDVYALGCVLFQAVTGEVPFTEHEASAKMWAHLNALPPSAGSRSDPTLAVLDPVIGRAMAKDPSERFPSAGDLGRAAVAAASGEAVTKPEGPVGSGEAAPSPETLAVSTVHRAPTTEPLPRHRRGPQTRRRRRGRWIAVLLALVALAAFGAGAAVEIPRLDDTETPSGPANRVTVPDLVGQPLDVAERQLHDAGLRPDRVGGGLFGVIVASDWDVCDSEPGPNSAVRQGSTVRLLIDRPDVC